jgi:hypothetical protein
MSNGNVIVDEKTRRKSELDSTCLRLKLQAKETRKKHGKRLAYILLISLFLVFGTYISYTVSGLSHTLVPFIKNLAEYLPR